MTRGRDKRLLWRKNNRLLEYRIVFNLEVSVPKDKKDSLTQILIPTQRELVSSEDFITASAQLFRWTKDTYGDATKMKVASAEYLSKVDGQWEIVPFDLIKKANERIEALFQGAGVGNGKQKPVSPLTAFYARRKSRRKYAERKGIPREI